MPFAVYEENSCLYLFTRETLLARRHRIGNRPYMFPMVLPAPDGLAAHFLCRTTATEPSICDAIKQADFESTDIDTEFEFSVAEAMATKMQLGGGSDVKYMLADKIGAGALPGGAKVRVNTLTFSITYLN
eukprot:SAG31_NODE_3506_length_4187_cov_1.703767_4_plen_130_part_00